MLRKTNKTAFFVSVLSVLFVISLIGLRSNAFADGTETLGPPSIAIASGSGIVAAGTGLVTQPGTININVPSAATVNQVLLYWEGQMLTNVAGDNTIEVNGQIITGNLIGGQVYFFSNAYSSAFRADITSLGLVSPGANTLSVEGLSFTKANNGAGIIVIYDDGVTSELGIVDGLDLAFIGFSGLRHSTVPQTFNFTPTAYDRTGRIALFFSSVEGTISGADPHRPTSIEVTVGGVTTTYSNLLASLDGDEWDTVNLPAFSIPANASSLTVQAFSRDDLGTGYLPASFSWIAAGLSVVPPLCGDNILDPGEECDGTADAACPGECLPDCTCPPEDGEGCTPGYWKNHLEDWTPTGYTPGNYFNAVFGVNYFKPDFTLGEAIKLKGGGVKKLGRHGTAALLSAAHPDVDYPYTIAEVIAFVQAGDADTLAAANELGCDIP